MINELYLLRVPNFIALGICFILGTKCSWNEGIDTCFNVECVLLGHNFYFFGGYLAVTTRYLVVTARYLVVTGGYCSFQLVPTFSTNDKKLKIFIFIFFNFNFFSKIFCILVFQSAPNLLKSFKCLKVTVVQKISAMIKQSYFN